MERVLLVIDMQNAFINEHNMHTVDNLKLLLDKKPNVFDTCIFTRYINSEDTACNKLLGYSGCWKGTYGVDITEKLQGYATKVIDKTTYGAITLDIACYLRDNQIDTVFIAGVDTDACVLATAYQLFDLCIRPVIITDCCGTTANDPNAHDNAIACIRRNMGPLSLALSTDV